MTVTGWIGWIMLSILIVGVAALIGSAVDKTLAGVLVGVIISGLLLGGLLFYFNGTAAGKRAYKTQESNFHNGIERTVEVYDATGNLLKTYSGKFDVDYDDNRIIFDDEKGKRHVIYYPTGTVIIDEV